MTYDEILIQYLTDKETAIRRDIRTAFFIQDGATDEEMWEKVVERADSHSGRIKINRIAGMCDVLMEICDLSPAQCPQGRHFEEIGDRLRRSIA